MALTLASYLYVYAWTDAGRVFIGDYDRMTPLFKILLFALAWSTILACVGFAAFHLNGRSAALACRSASASSWPSRARCSRTRGS